MSCVGPNSFSAAWNRMRILLEDVYIWRKWLQVNDKAMTDEMDGKARKISVTSSDGRNSMCIVAVHKSFDAETAMPFS
jgi:hypothetical protein